MKSISKISIIIIFSILFTSVSDGFVILENLMPQPQQSYIRSQYSGLFSLNSKNFIYLNPVLPDYNAAMEFNELMRTHSLDTLEFRFWSNSDTLSPGIFIGRQIDFLDKLILNAPDQKVNLSDLFSVHESYIIDAFPSKIVIEAGDEPGLHYGILTFFQLVDNSNMKNQVFACRIVDAPEFPIRWVYYPTNMLVGSNVTAAKKQWDIASSYKLNGMNVSDVKFDFISKQPQRYIDSLKSLTDYSKQKYLKFIPGIMSFGYSESLMLFNPNFASGLPVNNQKFIVESDSGRLVPTVAVKLPNPGFENFNGNNFSGFGFIDQPGTISFPDTIVKHSGKASIRFENIGKYDPQNGHARLNVLLKVSPYKYYHIGAWVKTQNLTYSDEVRMTAISTKGKTLNFANIPVSSTMDWEKIDICFNSLDADSLYAYWGVWGGKTGTIWWDDLTFEEIPFVNMIRRDGAPIAVINAKSNILYIEGADYDSLRDPKSGYLNPWPGDFDTYHTPPGFKIKKNSSINNGDTVLISYYNAITVYNGQVMVTMSDSNLYRQIEREFRIIDSIVKPGYYFIIHDEIRTMNYDAGDLARKLKPAEILADNVNKCVNIIRKYNINAGIWDWSDMFDEYHNAVEKNYFFVNGDLRGSADLIPKELGIGNWNSPNHAQSLNFFSNKGFKQISAPYYDKDENQIRIWKEWTRNTPDFQGMIYTTWTSNYSKLQPFAEYCWNHAPYIYHQPLYGINPAGRLFFPLRITGDKWDTGWRLDSVQILWRKNQKDDFTNTNFTIQAGTDTTVYIDVPDNNKYMQYFINAYDNRGWVTKVPFGKNNYWELGNNSTGVKFDTPIQNKFSLFPNPLVNVDFISAEWNSLNSGTGQLMIYNFLGQIVLKDNFNYFAGNNNYKIPIKQFNSGIYFVIIKLEDYICKGKLIITKSN